MRVLCEAQILQAVDHPFLASLWGTISTPTHLHFLMEPCSGGELYAVLNAQPHKRFPEATMRFSAAEVRDSVCCALETRRLPAQGTIISTPASLGHTTSCTRTAAVLHVP